MVLEFAMCRVVHRAGFNQVLIALGILLVHLAAQMFDDLLGDVVVDGREGLRLWDAALFVLPWLVDLRHGDSDGV